MYGNYERIFSAVNSNKTKLRNNLGSETSTGISHGKALTKDLPVSKIPLDHMVKMINKNMYGI